jgi:predicted dehydrogenase
VVGTGNRAEKFVIPLATTHADAGRIVAWCEPNPVRSDYYDEVLASHRYVHPAPRRYHPDAFADLLTSEDPDVVIVTSPDHTHARYVIDALERRFAVIADNIERLRDGRPLLNVVLRDLS